MIETRSETVTADNGATVEIGTVTFQGKEFQALGSVVDEQNGVIVGYVRTTRENKANQWGQPETRWTHELTSFDGEVLGPLKLTSTWDMRVPGGRSVRMRSFRFTYNGRTYTGRHGDMDLIRLRAKGAR